MLRESIGGILAGIGLLFSLATVVFGGLSIGSRDDFYWYFQSSDTMQAHYSWEGRQLYKVSGDSVSLAQEDSWQAMGYQALASLYGTTYHLMIAALVFSGLASLAFLAVGFFRWLYRYQTLHVEVPDRDQVFRVRTTYHSCRDLPLLKYFADRRRHGWGLLVTESLALLFALVCLSLMLAAIAMFAAEHPDRMRSDLQSISPQACLSPGPCFSLAGDQSSLASQSRSWRPGNGWAVATATLCFSFGALLLAVAQLTVRNNRFLHQDQRIQREEVEKADSREYFFSDIDLMSQSHLWQGQEKAYHPKDGWYQPLLEEPFDSSSSIQHQFREEL